MDSFVSVIIETKRPCVDKHHRNVLGTFRNSGVFSPACHCRIIFMCYSRNDLMAILHTRRCKSHMHLSQDTANFKVAWCARRSLSNGVLCQFGVDERSELTHQLERNFCQSL